MSQPFFNLWIKQYCWHTTTLFSQFIGLHKRWASCPVNQRMNDEQSTRSVLLELNLWLEVSRWPSITCSSHHSTDSNVKLKWATDDSLPKNNPSFQKIRPMVCILQLYFDLLQITEINPVLELFAIYTRGWNDQHSTRKKLHQWFIQLFHHYLTRWLSIENSEAVFQQIIGLNRLLNVLPCNPEEGMTIR